MTTKIKEGSELPHICTNLVYEHSEDGTMIRFICKDCGSVSEWEKIKQEE